MRCRGHHRSLEQLSPIESHLHTLNIVVAIFVLVAIVPAPVGPNLDRRPITAVILGMAAPAIGACVMLLANVAITANDGVGFAILGSV